MVAGKRSSNQKRKGFVKSIDMSFLAAPGQDIYVLTYSFHFFSRKILQDNTGYVCIIKLKNRKLVEGGDFAAIAYKRITKTEKKKREKEGSNIETSRCDKTRGGYT